MRKIIPILLILVIGSSCKKTYEVILPNTSGWELFNNPSATSLNRTTKSAMEGVYDLVHGTDAFGSDVALKWSYSVNGSDTTFHVSGFFGKDIAYFICDKNSKRDIVVVALFFRSST